MEAARKTWRENGVTVGFSADGTISWTEGIPSDERKKIGLQTTAELEVYSKLFDYDLTSGAVLTGTGSGPSGSAELVE